MITIVTKYLGATNYRGYRIAAMSYDWEGKKDRVVVPWKSELSSEANYRAAAFALVEKICRTHPAINSRGDSYRLINPLYIGSPDIEWVFGVEFIES